MHISVADARELAETYLGKCGMPPTDASVIADILLEAELRGRKTHGFIRLTGIKSRYEQGERTDIRVDKEEGQCIRVDGGNQPGYLVAYRAMEIAIERAKEKGFGLALITQILAGALVNAATIPPPGTNYGLLIITIDPTSFVPLRQFKTEVDKLLGRVKENRREAGITEILIPGERAYRQRAVHLAEGIYLDDTLLSQLT